MKAALWKIQLGDNQWMQQASQIRAGRHARAGERLLNRASATYSRATLQNQNALAGTRQVRSARKTVVTGSDDDHIPAARRQFPNGSGQSNFAKNGGRR